MLQFIIPSTAAFFNTTTTTAVPYSSNMQPFKWVPILYPLYNRTFILHFKLLSIVYLNSRYLLAIFFAVVALASAAVMPQQRLLPNSLIQLEASRPILQENANTLLGTLVNLEGNRPILPITSAFLQNIICPLQLGGPNRCPPPRRPRAWHPSFLIYSIDK